MRVFAALPLPFAAAASLAAALEPLRASCPRLRWVNADDYHVTLHFFGEVDAPRVDELLRVMEDARVQGPAISAGLGAIGQFPPQGAPRVLWAAMSHGGEQMRECWERFQQAIAPHGWTPEPRGFTPHVTVARAGRDGAERVDLGAVVIPPTPFAVVSLVLFQSLLGPGGARYVALKRIALAGNDG